ncbi:MAG: hypothetical protein M3332_08960, partial [Actinomycetota bacterium]|nr:hypothetical protein [Actinomycetota bacterium]
RTAPPWVRSAAQVQHARERRGEHQDTTDAARAARAASWCAIRAKASSSPARLIVVLAISSVSASAAS